MKHLFNQQGHIGLIFIALLMGLCSLFLWLLIEQRSHLFEIKDRVQHLLCLKEGSEQFRDYTDSMSWFNRQLNTLFIMENSIGSVFIKSRAFFKKAAQAMLALQNITRVSYLKNFLLLEHCRIDQRLQFVLQDPYGKIRHFDRTLSLKRRGNWDTYFVSFRKYQRNKRPLLTILEMQAQGRLQSVHIQGNAFLWQAEHFLLSR